VKPFRSSRQAVGLSDAGNQAKIDKIEVHAHFACPEKSRCFFMVYQVTKNRNT
jgi:hypothetical protein